MVRADLAFQLFEAFNPRHRDEIVGQEDLEAHDHRDIGAAKLRVHDGGSSARDRLELAGEERHQRLGRALDVEHVDVKAVFLIDAGFLRDPENGRRARVGRDVGQIHVLLPARGARAQENRQQG